MEHRNPHFPHRSRHAGAGGADCGQVLTTAGSVPVILLATLLLG